MALQLEGSQLYETQMGKVLCGDCLTSRDTVYTFKHRGICQGCGSSSHLELKDFKDILDKIPAEMIQQYAVKYLEAKFPP